MATRRSTIPFGTPAPWLVLAASLTLAACSASRLPPSPPLPTLQSAAPAAAGTYVLQLGDAVSVKFYNSPELNEDVVVRPDGMISLQLIGDVKAAGLTPAALAADLTGRYVQELSNPRISVIVRQLGTPPIYVAGEVGRQGVLPLTGGMTLYQAIQQAGGFQITAQRKQVILIRRSPEGRANGHSVDVAAVESGEHPEQDIPLQPYDVVFVPTSFIADVDNFVDLYIKRALPVQPGVFLGP
ncbi:MAG: polysaccharide export protein [Deltaproteobacteria bacterium]|nr:polysaccharide export protein [Deltaproteobacteria bacterium]